jgi:hypothetical protein
MPSVKCPGCELELPAQGQVASTRYRASGACERLYHELTAYNMERREPTFLHQQAVDAYAAQHAGPGQAPIGVVFAVVGLYLFAEHGFTGRQVQAAHTAMARKRRTWPLLDPPAATCRLNVAQVLAAAPGAPRDAMIRAWAADVWSTWQHERPRIAGMCRELLGVEPR